MYNDFIILNSLPDDNRFIFEVECFIEQNIRLDITQEHHILWFLPGDRTAQGWNPNVKKLEEKYKHLDYIKFFYYKDMEDLISTIGKIQYIPLLRPYCLRRHFENFPELSDKAIFYCDSDIVFTQKPDFSSLLQDETTYVSDTRSYLDSDYFEGKIKDVKPELKEQYEKNKVLEIFTEKLGVSWSKIQENKENTGGCQYLFKGGLTADFWQEVMDGIKLFRPYFMTINQHFYGSEDKGIQSWCADMAIIFWLLIKYDHKVKISPLLDFAWATDPIEKLQKVLIMHNAGVTSNYMFLAGKPTLMFQKTKMQYVNNQQSPHQDIEYLTKVSRDYCTGFYADCLLKVNNPVF